MATRRLSPRSQENPGGRRLAKVTVDELDGLSLRVAQARATIRIIRTSDCGADLQNALGLLEMWLDSVAEDLGDLAVRHQKTTEPERVASLEAASTEEVRS